MHHTYRVEFPPIPNRNSPIEGKNRSMQGAVHPTGLVRLVQLCELGFLNIFSLNLGYRVLKSNVLLRPLFLFFQIGSVYMPFGF